MFGTWMKLVLDTTMLALEAQQVIGLRLMKLALGGPGATREANRMVAEKVIALGASAANVHPSKMLHAALLLLMLEAVSTDLVSPSA